MNAEQSCAEDEKQIRRFREGQLSAFDEMVIKYSPKLYRVAYGLLGNKQDAEEVVQDAFVRAYRGLSEFRGDSSFETWMHRITVNLARNKFHWNKRRGEGANVSISDIFQSDDRPGKDVLDLDIPDTRHGPDRLLENLEIEDHILKAIEQLPEKFREIIVLRHFDDLSYEAIAELLGCKVGTVKSRLARARELLHSILVSKEIID